jgi:hypothetical protein
MDSTAEPASKKRLIVLIPEGLTDYSNLAHKIFRMALRDHSDVLYLTFVYDDETRLTISRGMATLKALTASDLVMVTSKMTHPDDWLYTLHSVYQPGDSIVCHEEQFIRNGFLKTIPIHDFLSEGFKAPIYTLTGFYHPWRVLSRKWLYGLLFWMGCLVILAGFSIMEIKIDREIQGVARTALIFIVLAFEFGAFWAWNHIPKI